MSAGKKKKSTPLPPDVAPAATVSADDELSGLMPFCFEDELPEASTAPGRGHARERVAGAVPAVPSRADAPAIDDAATTGTHGPPVLPKEAAKRESPYEPDVGCLYYDLMTGGVAAVLSTSAAPGALLCLNGQRRCVLMTLAVPVSLDGGPPCPASSTAVVPMQHVFAALPAVQHGVEPAADQGSRRWSIVAERAPFVLDEIFYRRFYLVMPGGCCGADLLSQADAGSAASTFPAFPLPPDAFFTAPPAGHRALPHRAFRSRIADALTRASDLPGCIPPTAGDTGDALEVDVFALVRDLRLLPGQVLKVELDAGGPPIGIRVDDSPSSAAAHVHHRDPATHTIVSDGTIASDGTTASERTAAVPSVSGCRYVVAIGVEVGTGLLLVEELEEASSKAEPKVAGAAGREADATDRPVVTYLRRTKHRAWRVPPGTRASVCDGRGIVVLRGANIDKLRSLTRVLPPGSVEHHVDRLLLKKVASVPDPSAPPGQERRRFAAGSSSTRHAPTVPADPPKGTEEPPLPLPRAAAAAGDAGAGGGTSGSLDVALTPFKYEGADLNFEVLPDMNYPYPVSWAAFGGRGAATSDSGVPTGHDLIDVSADHLDYYFAVLPGTVLYAAELKRRAVVVGIAIAADGEHVSLLVHYVGEPYARRLPLKAKGYYLVPGAMMTFDDLGVTPPPGWGEGGDAARAAADGDGWEKIPSELLNEAAPAEAATKPPDEVDDFTAGGMPYQESQDQMAFITGDGLGSRAASSWDGQSPSTARRHHSDDMLIEAGLGQRSGGRGAATSVPWWSALPLLRRSPRPPLRGARGGIVDDTTVKRQRSNEQDATARPSPPLDGQPTPTAPRPTEALWAWYGHANASFAAESSGWGDTASGAAGSAASAPSVHRPASSTPQDVELGDVLRGCHWRVLEFVRDAQTARKDDAANEKKRRVLGAIRAAGYADAELCLFNIHCFLSREIPLTSWFKPFREAAGHPGHSTAAVMADDISMRNLFEVKMGNGLQCESARTGWERRIFGPAYDKVTPADRPKYGVVNLFNDPIGQNACGGQYGDCYFIFRSDQAFRHRVTLTPTDSSDSSCSTCNFDSGITVLLSEVEDDSVGNLADLACGKVPYVASGSTMYREVQIHGDVLWHRHVSHLIINDSYLQEAATQWLPAGGSKTASSSGPPPHPSGDGDDDDDGDGAGGDDRMRTVKMGASAKLAILLRLALKNGWWVLTFQTMKLLASWRLADRQELLRLIQRFGGGARSDSHGTSSSSTLSLFTGDSLPPSSIPMPARGVVRVPSGPSHILAGPQQWALRPLYDELCHLVCQCELLFLVKLALQPPT